MTPLHSPRAPRSGRDGLPADAERDARLREHHTRARIAGLQREVRCQGIGARMADERHLHDAVAPAGHLGQMPAVALDPGVVAEGGEAQAAETERQREQGAAHACRCSDLAHRDGLKAGRPGSKPRARMPASISATVVSTTLTRA